MAIGIRCNKISTTADSIIKISVIQPLFRFNDMLIKPYASAEKNDLKDRPFFVWKAIIVIWLPLWSFELCPPCRRFAARQLPEPERQPVWILYRPEHPAPVLRPHCVPEF